MPHKWALRVILTAANKEQVRVAGGEPALVDDQPGHGSSASSSPSSSWPRRACPDRSSPTAVFAVGISTLVALVLAVRHHRPALGWPWWAISGAMALFLVGGGLRYGLHTLGNITASRSLVPDLISLPGYCLGAAGLLGFSRARDRGRQRHVGIVLDAVIAALAILAVAWVYVIDPVLFHYHTPLTIRLVLTCYPAMSIFLVVVTIRIAFSPDQDRVPSYWFLLAAMTCMFAGDTLYMFADIDLISVAGRFLDLPYGLAFVATGTMALHPSMRALTEPAGNRPQSTSPGRIVLVAVALLVPAVITLQRPVRARRRTASPCSSSSCA